MVALRQIPGTPPKIDVKIHTNDTVVFIYVSLLGKTLVGCIELSVIEDLHERFDMTPEEAEGFVVRTRTPLRRSYSRSLPGRPSHSSPSPARLIS
jgi:hypothetical protein